MNHQLTIDYPDTLPDFLQESTVEFEREAKFAMAVKLFESKRIPSGIAAGLVGMDRVSFLLKLHEYEVAMIDLDATELASDIHNA